MADKRGGLSAGALGLVNQGEAALGTTFTISSGHRDADYNATLPGAAKNSDHLTGDAFDISTRGMSNADAVAISDYYKSQSNTYVKDNYDDGHIHVSYRGPDNQMGHVNPGATDNPNTTGQKNPDGQNANANAASSNSTSNQNNQNTQNAQNNSNNSGNNNANNSNNSNSNSSCNPKVTGTGKPIGNSSSSNSSGSGNNNNANGNSNANSDGKGGTKDGSNSTNKGDNSDGSNKLKNDAQTNDLKYNKERADAIYDGLRDRGYSHEQAVAAMGHFYNESKFNTSIDGDSGTSYGLGQWHNERMTGLQNFAAQQGTSPSDLNTQLNYFDQEMRGSEASRAGNAFRNATSVADASAAMDNYERFKNYNVPGNFQSTDRLHNANTFDQAYSGRRT